MALVPQLLYFKITNLIQMVLIPQLINILIMMNEVGDYYMRHQIDFNKDCGDELSGNAEEGDPPERLSDYPPSHTMLIEASSWHRQRNSRCSVEICRL